MPNQSFYIGSGAVKTPLNKIQKKVQSTVPIAGASEFVRDLQKPDFFYPMNVLQTQKGTRSILDSL